MTSHCNICNRKLDLENDPLSADCGGDCWGCIGEIEADSDYEPSLEVVREEFKKGLRPDWKPKPKVNILNIKNTGDAIIADFEILISRPLGEPWQNESIVVNFLSRDHNRNISEILFSENCYTSEKGMVKISYTFPKLKHSRTPWIEISRNENKWAFPVRQD